MKPERKARDVRQVRSPAAHARKANGSSSNELHARVAKLAFSLYERRGCVDGHDVDDWIQAEQTIRQEMASEPNRTRTRSKS